MSGPVGSGQCGFGPVWVLGQCHEYWPTVSMNTVEATEMEACLRLKTEDLEDFPFCS